MIKDKILLITRNFPPLIGGMEKLNFNIFHALLSHGDVFVAGPVGSSKYHELNLFTEFPAKPLWKYIVFSLYKSIAFARQIKPNIVFCGSGAAILAGYFSAKLTGASLVCYLHGLDIVVDNKIYQWFFLPLIKKSDLILVNSNHTCMLAIAVGVNPSLIKVLSPGTSLPDLSKKIETSQQFRLEYNIGNSPFILIAGRITARKGITEFIKNVMPIITSAHPELQLVIIGDEAVDAMKHSAGIKDSIIIAVNELNLQANVKLIGSVDDAMLSAAFFSAEMLVFPVLNIENDVEGFGMVAIEAAAHGLPTVGFSVGGVPDAISHDRSGWLVESGSYSEMSQRILDAYSSSSGKVTENSCIQFARQFSWECFESKLNDKLKDFISEK
jgi:phosphatidylinositol alpha-1,6-mannosyltransferase